MLQRLTVIVLILTAFFSCSRKYTASFPNKNDQTNHSSSAPLDEFYASTSNEFTETLTNQNRTNISITDSTGCDVVFFKDGKEINAKILEVNQREIVYRLCNDITGTAITVSKSSIFLIKYANGTKEVMESSPAPSQQPSTIQNLPKSENTNTTLNNQAPVKRKLSLLALFSFLIPLIGLVILGIPAGITGIILGIISYIKIEKNKDRLKGQGFSIAGIALGATVLVLTLVALVILLG